MLEVKEQAVLLKVSERMMSLAAMIQNGNIYLKGCLAAQRISSQGSNSTSSFTIVGLYSLDIIWLKFRVGYII